MPTLKRVIRLDSQPIDQTFFTPEGYLRDRPVLTSTGIFEYENADGSVRRELRLPEDVFDPESLKSYKGKPVIITHDAGLVTKDNVAENQIGTILSEGFKDGNDVRAEIIIHDTDEMKSCGLKELSLGYNLDLEETPGEWEGEPYDAIQRNIRINHLALVREARAGEQARLNIDGRDSTLKGGKLMRKTKKRNVTRTDGILTPEELKKAIEEYKERRQSKSDSDDETAVPAVPAKAAVGPAKRDADDTPVDSDNVEEQVQAVKDRRDRRDEEGDPTTKKEAMETIANQDEDIDILFDIIDTLLAKMDFDDDDVDDENEDDDDDLEENTDCGRRKDCGNRKDCGRRKDADDDDDDFDEDDDDDENEDDDDDDYDEDDDDDYENEDDDDDLIPSTDEDDDDDDIPSKLNSDSVDRVFRDRLKVHDAAKALNMDGLDHVKPVKAKKTIIKAVKPGIRLDGKSKAYVNAMFDCVYDDIQKRSRKDSLYQKRQMFNKDSKSARRSHDDPESHRQKMIKQMQNNK